MPDKNRKPLSLRSQNRPFASVLAKGAKSKFLAETLEYVEMPNVDRAAGVVRAFRTEAAQPLIKAGALAKDNSGHYRKVEGKDQVRYRRGANESGSLMWEMSIYNDWSTEQAVPFSRVHSIYMHALPGGSNRGFFAADGESEFSFNGVGLNSSFHGKHREVKFSHTKPSNNHRDWRTPKDLSLSKPTY